jgi:hypothetical protein
MPLCQKIHILNERRILPSVDKTKGNSVSTDAERTPFLCNGLGEAKNGSLRRCIVGLTDVSVQA